MTRQSLAVVLFTAAAVVTAGALARAEAQKPVTQGEAVTETSVIQAIDSKARLVTLKNEDGTIDTIYCGPEVQRFDALKVGDKVTFRYYESIVYAITKPGATPPAATDAAIVRSKGAKPGATISQQMTATVTVLEIDAKVPSVTISTDDGSKMSFKIEDKKNLEGLKVGDKVQITYTQALAISVAPPSK